MLVALAERARPYEFLVFRYSPAGDPTAVWNSLHSEWNCSTIICVLRDMRLWWTKRRKHYRKLFPMIGHGLNSDILRRLRRLCRLQRSAHSFLWRVGCYTALVKQRTKLFRFWGKVVSRSSITFGDDILVLTWNLKSKAFWVSRRAVGIISGKKSQGGWQKKIFVSAENKKLFTSPLLFLSDAA